MNEVAQKALEDLMGETTLKMNMGKMQEMHDMMESCEGMAKKAKKMMETEMDNEDHEDMKRIPGSDIPVDIQTHVPMAQRELPPPEKAKVAFLEIQEAIKRIASK